MDVILWGAACTSWSLVLGFRVKRRAPLHHRQAAETKPYNHGAQKTRTHRCSWSMSLDHRKKAKLDPDEAMKQYSNEEQRKQARPSTIQDSIDIKGSTAGTFNFVVRFAR